MHDLGLFAFGWLLGVSVGLWGYIRHGDNARRVYWRGGRLASMMHPGRRR